MEWAVVHEHQKAVETPHVPEQNELGYVAVTADLGAFFSRSTYCPLQCNKTDRKPRPSGSGNRRGWSPRCSAMILIREAPDNSWRWRAGIPCRGQRVDARGRASSQTTRRNREASAFMRSLAPCTVAMCLAWGLTARPVTCVPAHTTSCSNSRRIARSHLWRHGQRLQVHGCGPGLELRGAHVAPPACAMHARS